jgi:4-carboxymuconolactone decarboxylase
MSPALPPDVDPQSLSRLPLRRREDLDEDGRRFYDAAVAPGSRTLVGLRGPSGIWLHSPRLGERVRTVNQYLRFETGLPRRLTELAILVTARELDNQFEWTAHEPAALADGLAQAIIDVVKHRRPADGLPPEESVIIAFGREAFRDRKVRPETFARAVQLFGREGVVNLAALMGNYAMTAVILDAVDQQLHPEREPLLPPSTSSPEPSPPPAAPGTG